MEKGSWLAANLTRVSQGVIVVGVATLLAQKFVSWRRERKHQREMHPVGSYSHFKKLEEAGRKRLESYGGGV